MPRVCSPSDSPSAHILQGTTQIPANVPANSRQASKAEKSSVGSFPPRCSAKCTAQILSPLILTLPSVSRALPFSQLSSSPLSPACLFFFFPPLSRLLNIQAISTSHSNLWFYFLSLQGNSLKRIFSQHNLTQRSYPQLVSHMMLTALSTWDTSQFFALGIFLVILAILSLFTSVFSVFTEYGTL